MKILSLRDVIRKDIPIYYRRLYTGVVLMELNSASVEFRIDFSIEHKPTGEKLINVTFIEKVDYPIVPISKEIKNYIDAMDNNGALPD